MSGISLAEILKLPVRERIKLAQAIWDSVSALPEPYPLTDGERQKLDRRLDAYRRDPNAVSPWPEVKARILGRA